MRKNLLFLSLPLLTAATASAFIFGSGDSNYDSTRDNSNALGEVSLASSALNASEGTLNAPQGSLFGNIYDPSSDFWVANSDGILICYHPNGDEFTVSVTYKNENYNTYYGDVVIPENVTFNGYTFTVTGVGKYAFYDSSRLTSVILPSSISFIDNYAFGNCSQLASIDIPSSVTSIGLGAFTNCKALTSVEIPNSVEVINNDLFKGCTALTSVTLPNSVESISSYAFYGCSALKDINFPSSLTSIYSYAFYGCSSLTSIVLPPAINYIGEGAFRGCRNISDVTVMNQNPEKIILGTSVFVDLPLASATLHVPEGSLALYEVAPQWEDFGNKVEMAAERVDAFSIEAVTLSTKEVTKVPVCLANENEITSFICYLRLPEGLALAKDYSGTYDFSTSDRLNGTFNVDGTEVNGLIKIRVYSTGNYAIEGNEGPVFNLPIEVTDAEAKAGSKYEISLEDISMTLLPGFNEVYANDARQTLAVGASYTPGDVNGDGRFSVTDVSLVVSFALGKNPANGIFEAADMDGSGAITVVDVSKIVSLVLSGASALKAPVTVTSDAEYVDAVLVDGDKLVVKIGNLQSYVSSMMDINLPQGVEIKSARLTGRNADNHVLTSARLTDGKTRLLVYSLSNANFADSDNFVEIELAASDAVACADFSIDNVLLVANNGNRFEEVRACDLVSNLGTTGIGAVAVADANIVVNGRAFNVRPNADGKYVVSDLQGRLYEVANGNVNLVPGVYFINSQKVLIK